MKGKEALNTIELAINLYLQTHDSLFAEELKKMKEYDWKDDAEQDLEYDRMYAYSKGYKDFAEVVLNVLKEKHNEF